jgi:hypothetical protein
MEPQTDTTTVTIEASADSVWRLLADDFLENAAWAPGVISSAQNPATPDGVNGSRFGGRVSEIEGLGQAKHLDCYSCNGRYLHGFLQN